VGKPKVLRKSKIPLATASRSREVPFGDRGVSSPLRPLSPTTEEIEGRTFKKKV